MDMKIHEGVIDKIRDMEKSMRVSVKIPRDEADRIVITRLIKVRNLIVSRNKDITHFDKVIRHYLTEDEFQKYVIKKVEIEY